MGMRTFRDGKYPGMRVTGKMDMAPKLHYGF